MKKFLAAVIVIGLMFTIPAFAGNETVNIVEGEGNTGIQGNNNHHNNIYGAESGGTAEAEATGIGIGVGIGIMNPEFTDVNINRVDVNTTDVNINHNQQSQIQGDQSQNNNQTIAPTQSTNVKIQRPHANIPSTGTPEMNFGNGTTEIINWHLPKFKGVVYYNYNETIHTIMETKANVPYKKLYKTILELAREHSVQSPYMRFQIIMLEGQKTWTTGGGLILGGTGPLGTSGAAGSGSLIPAVGATKAHPLFHIIVVNVIP